MLNPSTADVLCKGMDALIDRLGIVEAEHFITIVNRERFDYTKWQREYFDRMTPEELMEKAVQFSKEHPFRGKKATILSAEA